MASTTASFSFKPWIRQSKDEGSLQDVLGRVNLERGHFRDITEASLQEDIAGEGALELSESEKDDDEQEDEADVRKGSSKPATREELYKTKYEMLANVRAAEQEILMSLDFVSLLLSKDAPKQAQTTLSPVLKEAAPVGSLGTDLWQRMPVDRAREAQDELLATNVRMQGFQQSANSLLAAASRLEDNVRKETEYWKQILSITEHGWNVSRIPGQQNRLGVRFGFSESSAEFSRRGIAALNASSTDGTIMLERGIGSKPKALHAVLRKDGKIVGTSKLPDAPNTEETTLEARIRYARDSLYDEELYHEVVRESRTLASLGVSIQGSSICHEPRSRSDTELAVSLDLVSLDEYGNSHPDSTNEEDALAQALVLAARLLLGQAHRDRLQKRSEVPAPLSDKEKDKKPSPPILRPILSFIMHRSGLERLNVYVETLSHVLEAAKIHSSLTSACFELPKKPDEINAEALTNMLMQPWVSEAKESISAPDSDDLIFSFKIETTLAYGFGTVITLKTPSATQGYRFDVIDDLIAAADAKVATALAKELRNTLGGDWDYNENEALLVKDTRIDENTRSLRVTLDSQDKFLTLDSHVNGMSWKLDGECSQYGFWDAALQLLAYEK